MPHERLTAKILRFIGEYPGASIKDVSQALNISTNIIRSILYRLKNNGYVEKAGNGYYLTNKGEWLLGRITGEAKTRIATTEEKEASEKQSSTTTIRTDNIAHRDTGGEQPRDTMGREEPGISTSISMNTLIERIRILEEKIYDLEKKVRMIEEKLAVKESKHVEGKPKRNKEAILATPPTTSSKEKNLPYPVMSIPEARAKLGSLYDKLLYSGKIVVINSIVVDSDYYNEFIKKFPISIKEAEKLSPLEKKILEEMKKDARVILKAGKRYELVK